MPLHKEAAPKEQEQAGNCRELRAVDSSLNKVGVKQSQLQILDIFKVVSNRPPVPVRKQHDRLNAIKAPLAPKVGYAGETSAVGKLCHGGGRVEGHPRGA
jgi:hypothetical protein